MRLKDKVAIITGGGRDIGREVSRVLAREGAKVVINFANDEASAAETLDSITSAGGEAIVCRADVTTAEGVATLVAAARDAYGAEVHILVNLAGGMVERRPLADIDEAFFDTVMTLNLKSAYLMTRAVAPLMTEGAAIINFSSQAGRDGGGPGAAIYATSKGALMTFTRSMAKELGPRGVRVNSLCPGMIATSFHDTFTKPEVRTAVAAGTPLRRQGRPEEVAETVLFLASDAAAFVTGANLDINGGLYFS
ncbi:SDR family NAD(P)-dependent oxidoreductase [Brevundimonas subvibrioides]|uniref:D-xylose 1-dehydrogenase n=1 Tax=Brevundimonas subvibrioides (strain ATCC 15264 / DSM 4735 / LMG 14903 / NBRC 16000 / CB 81) TaxID=633149 RepID=D9QNG6_BRESC|nr:glucose 1-dehydrogenase [Brevundimonas subvibrioides]ADL02201.1 short-chain dehydrogenase/reductase SDR [Brevundimonas subvibrioides ATCC 15264]